MTGRFASLALACAVAVPRLHAQNRSPGDTIRAKCGDPKIPVGVLKEGSAKVRFNLAHDRPDTESVVVVKVQNASVAGARSAAARQLAECRFTQPKGANASAILSAVNFNQLGATVVHSVAAHTQTTALPVESFDLAANPAPLESTDPRVEEQPRSYKCRAPPMPSLNSRGSGATLAEAQAQANASTEMQAEGWNQVNAGHLIAQIVIDADGRLEDSIAVVSVSNRAAKAALLSRIRDCKWTPGRYRGVAVPVRLRMDVVTPALIRQ